jgi:quercetin dioxygenase-like cupin family protein
VRVVRRRDPEPTELEKHFTGHAAVENRLDEQRPLGVRVAVATFRDGGRTLWHRHDGEQVLYVLRGTGWAQQDGEAAVAIERGDVIYVAPGERHWHGARAGAELEHLTVTIGGTEWEEEVDASAAALL